MQRCLKDKNTQALNCHEILQCNSLVQVVSLFLCFLSIGMYRDLEYLTQLVFLWLLGKSTFP